MSSSAPEREQEPRTDDGAGGAAALALVAALAGLVVLPVALGWLFGPWWAQRPSAWRPVSPRVRVGVAAAAVTGPVLAGALTWPLLDGQPGPGRAATLLALWWLALTPAAVVVARLRARAQGTALAAGRCAPTTADNVRRAAWDATTADLARRAGVLTRPLRVLDAEAVPAELLGTATVHDARDAWTRYTARAVHRDPQSSWHTGRREAGFLELPPLPPRVAMFGSSGSGKTVAQHRLVMAALERDWRVLWLDGKGDPDDARALLEQAGARGLATRWLNLAAPDGGQPYDLWRGDGSAVARKAAALMPRAAQGGTEHFAAWEVYTLDALARTTPWRSCAELLGRLAKPGPWVGDDDRGRRALKALNNKSSAGTKVVENVAAQVTAALTPLMAYVDGGEGSWSLDDDSGWDLAVASLDAGAVTGAERVAAALLLDLDAYRIARRTPEARPLLVIADELGAVLADPRTAELVPRLMEQVRSQRIGLVIAAQSPSTLGETGPRLLAAGLDLWVGRVDEPEDLVMLMGTSKRAEQAHQGTDNGLTWTGQTAAREQDGLLVDPSVLRNLPTWTWLVKEARCAPTWAVVPPTPRPPDHRDRPNLHPYRSVGRSSVPTLPLPVHTRRTDFRVNP